MRQASFSSGELSPRLHGRTDIEAYAKGLRRAKNFLVTPEGAVCNRPGTLYVATCKDSGDTHPPRLIPFIYNSANAYVLEVGHHYIRFIHNGSPVMDGDEPYEVETPYPGDSVRLLKYVQVGRTMTLTLEGYAPHELTWNDIADWTLTEAAFAVVDAYFEDNEVYLEDPLPEEDATHPAREWVWLVTQVVMDSATGATYETQPFTVVESAASGYEAPFGSVDDENERQIPVYVDKPVRVRWPTTAGTPPAEWATLSIIAYRVYRGRGEAFGFMGETTGSYFVDVGEEPNWAVRPPNSRNPFVLRNASYDIVRTERPYAVGFFEERLIFFGTTERPGTVFGSRTGSYLDFDLPNPGVPGTDAAIEFAIASNRREEARSVVGLEQCFLFTDAGVWTLSGGDGPLTETSVRVSKQSDEGATWVSPLVVGDSLLYVREKGVGVNEFAYANERGKFQANDLTVFARHLVEQNEILEWAYAHDPYRIVWAVRDDGILLSLTYHRALGTIAWTWHRTGTQGGSTTGRFESVCTVPDHANDGLEDAVYCVVQRGSDPHNWYVEKFSTRRVEAHWTGGADEAVFLDCASTYSNEGPLVELTDLQRLENETVTVVGDGNVLGAYVVTDGTIDFSAACPDGAHQVQVGLLYVPELETLDMPDAPRMEMKGRPKTVRATILDVENSRGFSVGETSDDLRDWQQRRVSDSYEAIAVYTGEVEVPISSTWNEHGRVFLRQSNPLPLTVLGLTRKAAVGGD